MLKEKKYVEKRLRQYLDTWETMESLYIDDNPILLAVIKELEWVLDKEDVPA